MSLPVTPLGPAEAFEVPSRSHPNGPPHVVLRLVGAWKCSCPARVVPCWHISQVWEFDGRKGCADVKDRPLRAIPGGRS